MSDLVARDPAALSPIVDPVSTALAMIDRAARDSSVDVAKMQALQEMQFRLIDRFKVDQWHEAVASLPRIRVKKSGVIDLGVDKRDGKARGTVPFARWEDMDDVLRPLLEAAGLFLTFDSAPRAGDGGGLIVTGFLHHRSGHFKPASMPLPMDTGPGRNNLQAYGSTLSYGKRYTAEMLLNIVREGEDDDGKRGGMRFVTEAQADELRTLTKEAGRQEGALLDRLFSGTIHVFEEVEAAAFVVVRNTLDGIIHQKKSRSTRPESGNAPD